MEVNKRDRVEAIKLLWHHFLTHFLMMYSFFSLLARTGYVFCQKDLLKTIVPIFSLLLPNLCFSSFLLEFSLYSDNEQKIKYWFFRSRKWKIWVILLLWKWWGVLFGKLTVALITTCDKDNPILPRFQTESDNCVPLVKFKKWRPDKKKTEDQIVV